MSVRSAAVAGVMMLLVVSCGQDLTSPPVIDVAVAEPTSPAASTAVPATPSSVTPDWSSTGALELVQAEPGSEFVAVIATSDEYERIVGRATADSAGAVQLDYTIPSGVAPGAYVLAVRARSDGQRVAGSMITIEVPGECVGQGAADVDGDNLDDDCDPNLLDGPAADFDNDGVANRADNCLHHVNPNQERNFERSSGAACDEREGNNRVSVLDNPCLGLVPTLVGTDGDDELMGTDGDDVISGLGGDDVISAGLGDDVICVTGGTNVLEGGGGDDRIFGGPGDDTIVGGAGNDHLSGGSGDDDIRGGGGVDRIDGGQGSDLCAGAAVLANCES